MNNATATLRTSEQTAPAEPAQPSGRNPRGQFAPGNPGGPGRPPQTLPLEREVIALLARAISPEDWVNVAQAAVRKAVEGNMTAIGLLMRTFLNGRLNAAAAAEAIGLPAEVEMCELGRKLHAGWASLVAAQQATLADPCRGEENARAEAAAEMAAVAHRESGAPAEPGGQGQPTNGQPTNQASAGETVTAEARPAAVTPQAPEPAPLSAPRVTPHAERVCGFRVTKGPRPENGRNRQNAGKSAVLAGAAR